MMGTSADLSAQENIEAMHFMESEVLKIATRRNFTGILTTNTSPLTQQLGSNVYKYETMLDYKINQYVYGDGSRPFGKASDDQRVIVHWKDIRKHRWDVADEWKGAIGIISSVLGTYLSLQYIALMLVLALEPGLNPRKHSMSKL